MNAFKRILTVGLLVLFNSFLFSQNGNQQVYVMKERLDSTVQFSQFEKIEYIYNDSGNNSSAVTYEWSTINKQFEESLRTEFTYNPQGHCILNQHTKWDKTSSQWIEDNKTESGYDEEGQLLFNNYYNWNKLSNNWELAVKTDCVNSYDSIGRLSSVACTVESKTLNTTTLSKYFYTYHPNGTLLTVLRSDMGSVSLLPVEKDEYSYDSDGNLTTRTNFTYHNRIWHAIGTDDFTFNTLNDGNQLIIPQEYVVSRLMLPVDYYFGCMITSQTHTVGNNIWTKVYYYSSIDVTGIKDQQAVNTTVFPNPATDYLNIQWKGNQAVLRVELFDTSGKKIFRGNVMNHSKLAIQAYPKGLYLVKLSDNHQIVKTEKVYFY
ncbi:MAG TPA: hypothetical protein DCL77_20425 [Prolixibacteraceae bacterium]|jgi:hypothetical protein|nr:hypothetical protein [Prolixibacteraceae bacterium]